MAAAAGVVMVAGMAQATTTHSVRPGDLARGANAKQLYADAESIHPRGGAPVALPSPTGALLDSRRLLGGRASTGWVVWEHRLVATPVDEVTMVDDLIQVQPNGPSRVIYTHSMAIPDTEGHQYGFWAGLSENGKRTAALVSDFQVGRLVVRDLSGTIVGKANDVGRVADFSGPRVAFQDPRSRVFVWKPGHKPQRVSSRRSNFVDLQHHVVFFQTADQLFGPTSLTHPGKVRWKAGFHPMQLSPSGKRVVGYRWFDSQQCGFFAVCPPGRPTMQIRRMSDGKVLASFRVDNPYQDLTWEGNDAVLYPDHDPTRGTDEAVVVRCRVTGACVRATNWFDDGGQFSFPHTYPTE